MAGPSKSLVLDPALQKYYEYSSNRWRYFKWTPRNAWLSFAYMALIPASLAYLGYKTEGKYHLRGKRRGDPIAEW